jgi:hypothetical protein
VFSETDLFVLYLRQQAEQEKIHRPYVLSSMWHTYRLKIFITRIHFAGTEFRFPATEKLKQKFAVVLIFTYRVHRAEFRCELPATSQHHTVRCRSGAQVS